VYIAPARAHPRRRWPTEGFLVLKAEAAAGAGNSFTTILFLLLLFGVVYFLMIRPQQKRRREAQQMQSALGPGDRIVTIGGLHGTVVTIDDDLVVLESSPGVELTFARQAIARVLPREEEAVADEVVAEEPVVDEPAVVEEPVVDPVTDTRKKD
jgi:preprotein translocase subunit YajC